MYNKLLSTQWIYDRCLEFSYFGILMLILLALGLGLIFYRSTGMVLRNLRKNPTDHVREFKKKSLLHLIITSIFIATQTSLLILGVFFMASYLPKNDLEMVLSISSLLIIVGTVFIASISRSSFREKAIVKKIVLGSKIITLTILNLPLAFTIYLFAGYFFVGCTDDMFWRAVRPAHQIHGQLKNLVIENKPLPKTETELRELNPNLYSEIESNAKTQYIYSQEDNTFTWFVRPSKYFTVLFDSKNDFKIYKLSFIEHFHSQSFPPDYHGPWDQLPNK